MTVQFNTGKNIAGSEEFTAPIIALISEELGRFSSQITRVEVHLTDEDSNKDSLNDKRCLLEARLAGMKPIVVSNNADSVDQAVEGALEKLKTSLDTILGRLSNHH